MDLPNQSSNSNGNPNPLIPDQQPEISVQNNASETTANSTNHLPVESGQDESTFPNHPSFPSIYECPCCAQTKGDSNSRENCFSNL